MRKRDQGSTRVGQVETDVYHFDFKRVSQKNERLENIAHFFVL